MSEGSRLPNDPPVIAFIDDEQPVVRFAERILRVSGYSVLCGFDGEEALALRFGRPEPDAMLVNWVMPGINGDEVISRIRKREAVAGLGRLPMALESGSSACADARRLAEIGADGFLMKPFQTDELLDLVRRLLEKRAPAET